MSTSTYPSTHAEWRASLLGSGYRDLDEIKGIRVGSRVHHIGERYDKAYRDGTATVLAIMEKDPSHWSVVWGRRDIELIVERDESRLEGMSQINNWADYHSCLVEAS